DRTVHERRTAGAGRKGRGRDRHYRELHAESAGIRRNYCGGEGDDRRNGFADDERHGHRDEEHDGKVWRRACGRESRKRNGEARTRKSRKLATIEHKKRPVLRPAFVFPGELERSADSEPEGLARFA